jgi:hypothetical protein
MHRRGWADGGQKQEDCKNGSFVHSVIRAGDNEFCSRTRTGLKSHWLSRQDGPGLVRRSLLG